MNKKQLVKVIIDLLLTFTFILFFNIHVVRLDVHEILGLVIILPIVIHLFLNWKWIIQVGKKLFSKSTKASTKFKYVLDILLFVGLALIIISGVFISRSLFPDLQISNHMLWRNIHISASYLSLILLSVHIGMNWDWVISMTKKIFKVEGTTRAAEILTPIALALIFVFGAYNIMTQGVLQKTFVITQVNNFTEMKVFDRPANGFPGDNQNKNGEKIWNNPGNEGGIPLGPGDGDRKFQGNGQGKWGSGNWEGKRNGFEGGREMGREQSRGVTGYINLLLNYASICGVFIILTHYTRKYFSKA